MSKLYIVKAEKGYNKYAEQVVCNEYKVVFYCGCVHHYPASSKDDIVAVGVQGSQFEGVKELEIAWIETCACKCYDLCNLEFQEGDYAYLENKFWKIVGHRVTNDCGCYYIRLTLERLVPRETNKKLIECVDCFCLNDFMEECDAQ